MLGVLNLHHAQGFFPARADVRCDADFTQHKPGMLRRNPVIVHHEDIQGVGID